MANRAQRQALVMSCEVPGEEPLPGARYNAEKLSKFFRRANVPTRCVYGGKLTLDRAKEDIRDFFSTHCDVHVLYGIFHGHAGSWKLSDGTTLGLTDILEQWDLAKQLGTAQHLLIVSDACESGRMVDEAARQARPDVAAQASCSSRNVTSDVVGETFTEYLLWNMQGRTSANKRGIDMLVHIEPALRNLGPCYYCPDRSNYRGWIFVDEHDGADFSSSRSLSLRSDTSEDTFSQRSHPPGQEDAFSPTSDPPGQEEIGSPRSPAGEEEIGGHGSPERRRRVELEEGGEVASRDLLNALEDARSGGQDFLVEQTGTTPDGTHTRRVQILAPTDKIGVELEIVFTRAPGDPHTRVHFLAPSVTKKDMKLKCRELCYALFCGINFLFLCDCATRMGCTCGQLFLEWSAAIAKHVWFLCSGSCRL